jgi:hypothetical protein
MTWKRMLAYITGSVDEELLQRNEYLASESQILRSQIKGRVRLNDADRIRLAEIGKRLGRKALAEVARIVRPETIMAWHRRLVARKFDGTRHRKAMGRPPTSEELTALVVKFAEENRTWGYDRIVGALENLGHRLSRQTRLMSRQVHIVGIAPEPGENWMKQVARNLTDASGGFLRDCRFLIHDRASLFSEPFRTILESVGVEPLRLPARSPNLNAFAERFVRSIKESCLDKLILVGESSLQRAVREFASHYHHERNHQGLENKIIRPEFAEFPTTGTIHSRSRLGGMLRYYYREAA